MDNILYFFLNNIYSNSIFDYNAYWQTDKKALH